MNLQKEARDDLREWLSQGLGEFYEAQMGIRPQEVEVRFAGDLILARYKGVLSPSDLNPMKEKKQ